MKEILNSLGFEELPMLSCLMTKEEQTTYRGDCSYDYKGFITQPLTLSMFVPVSEEPESYNKHLEIEGENHSCIGWNKEDLALGLHKQCQEYQKAKERVIFERCEIAEEFATRSQELQSTIEYAINNGVKLKLIK